jgi:hypothetical protein
MLPHVVFKASEAPEPAAAGRAAESPLRVFSDHTELAPPADYLEDGNYDVLGSAVEALDAPVAFATLGAVLELCAAVMTRLGPRLGRGSNAFRWTELLPFVRRVVDVVHIG